MNKKRAQKKQTGGTTITLRPRFARALQVYIEHYPRRHKSLAAAVEYAVGEYLSAAHLAASISQRKSDLDYLASLPRRSPGNMLPRVGEKSPNAPNAPRRSK